MQSTRISDAQTPHACPGNPPDTRGCFLLKLSSGMKIGRALLLSLVIAVLSTLPMQTGAQSVAFSGDSSTTVETTNSEQLDLTYVHPTQRTKVNNFVFDAFGPYPIVGAAFAAGINQFSNAPPEWHQGVEGYSKRFGSDFGIAAIGTMTRYGLAEAFKEDTVYYRCECNGILPRLRHAIISTLTGRRADDGHRIFSIPALVSPYAGSTTAVYGWYPNRFGAKDAFRIGNYSLLAYMGGNIALEFFVSPGDVFSRFRRRNSNTLPIPGQDR